MSTYLAGRRAAVKAGCKSVHFSLDSCPLSCYFSGSVVTTSGHFVHKLERRTRDGAFIYALSADETRPALAAPRHASTALFSCRFKCPCPPRRQRHFHGNADRAYNTLHFALQSRVPNGGVAPFGNPHKKRRYATPLHGAHTAFSCYPALRLYQLSKSQRGIDVVSLTLGKSAFPFGNGLPGNPDPVRQLLLRNPLAFS